MLLGAAALLSEEKELPAPVRLIFQPAEEKGTGALAMIKAGALEGAGMIFGGHLDRHYHPGAIVVAEGAVNASSDNFTIEIIGQGAHGARPHESIDAVVVGSLMIMALQTIVSRAVDPARPSVVSVGQFHDRLNVIAGLAGWGDGSCPEPCPATTFLRTPHQSIAQLHGAKIQS
jgi:hippurate hydrolase